MNITIGEHIRIYKANGCLRSNITPDGHGCGNLFVMGRCLYASWEFPPHTVCYPIDSHTTQTVYSSHGDFTIDLWGNVIDKDLCDSEYDNIVRFNVDEYNDFWSMNKEPETQSERGMVEGFDILDLGYWMSDGTYEEPAYEWRKEIALNLQDEGYTNVFR